MIWGLEHLYRIALIPLLQFDGNLTIGVSRPRKLSVNQTVNALDNRAERNF